MSADSSFDKDDSAEDSTIASILDNNPAFVLLILTVGFALLFGTLYLTLADFVYIFIEYGFTLGVIINLGIAVAILLMSSLFYFIAKGICLWRSKFVKKKIKTVSATGFVVMPSFVNSSVKIIDFNNRKTIRRLFIPSTLDNKTVREIAANAFSESPLLTSVEIEDGIEVVGLGAFQRCVELQSASLPSSLCQIDSRAFSENPKLRTLFLSEGLIKIDDCAFFKCPSLRSVMIPRSVCHIGRVAFDKSTTLLVHPNSYAEAWAIKNRYSFQRIN